VEPSIGLEFGCDELRSQSRWLYAGIMVWSGKRLNSDNLCIDDDSVEEG
jgi:hypothetical protein